MMCQRVILYERRTKMFFKNPIFCCVKKGVPEKPKGYIFIQSVYVLCRPLNMQLTVFASAIYVYKEEEEENNDDDDDDECLSINYVSVFLNKVIELKLMNHTLCLTPQEQPD